MFPPGLQRRARRVAELVVSPLARWGVTPNLLTVIGFLFNVVTAAVLASGRLRLAAVLLLLSSPFDMLDGALARISGRQSAFGAFLDSLLDRYAEAAILLALVFVFAVRHDTMTVLLVYVVAVGSLLISYARARAEGLGLKGEVGIAPRPERIVILGVGLLFNTATTVAALLVLALLTHVTAMQRLYYVRRQTRHEDDASPRRSAARPHETHSV